MNDLISGEFLPHIPIGKWFTDLVDWINETFSFLITLVNSVLLNLNDLLSSALTSIPDMIAVLLLAGLAAWAKGWRFGLFALAGLLLVFSMELWTEMMNTLALVLVSASIAMVIAVPLGILAAFNQVASGVIRPLMDFMQTMPAFVYLIPALFFFSVGVVPGIVSTIIFAMPPGVRLTELGIRQVDPEIVEAGHAFGASPRSILTRIQIPLALPTIMAGVNQVIMLSLSMVVIAGMVGAGGLGELVYQGVTRLDLGLGFEAGLAVVVTAIYLDRLTSALADRTSVNRREGNPAAIQ